MTEANKDFRIGRIDCTNDEYTELSKRAMFRHVFGVHYHSSSINDGTNERDLRSWVELVTASKESFDWANGELEHIRVCQLVERVSVEIKPEDLSDADIDSVMTGGRPALEKWIADGNTISRTILVRFDDLQEKADWKTKTDEERAAVIKGMGGSLFCRLKSWSKPT